MAAETPPKDKPILPRKPYTKRPPNLKGTDYLSPRQELEEQKRPTDVVPRFDPEGAVERTDNEGPHNVHGGGKQMRITAYGCDLIRFYRSRGLPIPNIAQRLGMGSTQLYSRIQRQPEVKQALEEGLAEMEFTLTECLMGMAERGNVVAAIYLTKVLLKWRDNDPPPPAQVNNVVMYLPKPMSLETMRLMQESGITPKQLQEQSAPPTTLDTDGEPV